MAVFLEASLLQLCVRNMHTIVCTVWPTAIIRSCALSGHPGCKIGLARTVYMHRIWSYDWWFPCQKYSTYTVFIWLWPTLCKKRLCWCCTFGVPCAWSWVCMWSLQIFLLALFGSLRVPVITLCSLTFLPWPSFLSPYFSVASIIIDDILEAARCTFQRCSFLCVSVMMINLMLNLQVQTSVITF